MIAATLDPATKKTALEQRFRELAGKWKSECALISSTNDMATHFAYQQIIGMGPDVLPILLEEMQREPDHWSWACVLSPVRIPSTRNTAANWR